MTEGNVKECSLWEKTWGDTKYAAEKRGRELSPRFKAAFDEW